MTDWTDDAIEISYITSENIRKVRGEGFLMTGTFIYLGHDMERTEEKAAAIKNQLLKAYLELRESDFPYVAGDSSEWLMIPLDSKKCHLDRYFKATEFETVKELKEHETKKSLARSGIKQATNGRAPN